MIDTGAQPNIIKKELIKDPLMINEDNTTSIVGIDKDPIKTIGLIRVKIDNYGKLRQFLVVSDDFVIQTNALVGAMFLNSCDTTINVSIRSLLPC